MAHRRLMKVSDALDSGDIKTICLAVENLISDDFELSDYQESLLTILLRFSSFDLIDKRADAKKIVRSLLSSLNGSNLRIECTRLICEQVPVCSTVAADFLISENLQLSVEECNSLANRLYSHEFANVSNLSEWMERIAMACRVLRKSEFSKSHAKKLFMESLEIVLSQDPDISIRKQISSFPIEFLTELMEFAPGHPFLEIDDSAQTSSEYCFVPRVQSVNFRIENAITGFSEVLSSTMIYKDKDAYSYLNLFEFISKNLSCLQLQRSHVTSLAKFWKCGFRLTNGIDLSSTQRMVTLFKLNCELFNVKVRALFLKRLLRVISEDTSVVVAYDPQISALIIDTYRRDIRVLEFQTELGEFWTVAYSLKYNNVYNSVAFYSALMALAKTQALFRINKGLCREVLSRILKPIHEKMVDFRKMKDAESESKSSSLTEATILDQQENLGSELFDMLAFSYEDARSSVETFLAE